MGSIVVSCHQYTEADRATVVALNLLSGSPVDPLQLAAELDDPLTFGLVVRDERSAVGACLAWLGENSNELIFIAVARRARRQGVGTTMVVGLSALLLESSLMVLNTVPSLLTHASKTSLWADVPAESLDVQKCLQSCGFVAVADTDGRHWQEAADTYRMICRNPVESFTM